MGKLDVVYQSLRLFIEIGKHPGTFCEAMLCNDLQKTLLHSPIDIADIPAFLNYVSNNVPAVAWGSRHNFESWIKLGGRAGLDKRANVVPFERRDK